MNLDQAATYFNDIDLYKLVGEVWTPLNIRVALSSLVGGITENGVQLGSHRILVPAATPIPEDTAIIKLGQANNVFLIASRPIIVDSVSKTYSYLIRKATHQATVYRPTINVAASGTAASATLEEVEETYTSVVYADFQKRDRKSPHRVDMPEFDLAFASSTDVKKEDTVITNAFEFTVDDVYMKGELKIALSLAKYR
jgi:hypothetical protein